MDYNNLGHEVQESNYWAACDKAQSKSSCKESHDIRNLMPTFLYSKKVWLTLL